MPVLWAGNDPEFGLVYMARPPKTHWGLAVGATWGPSELTGIAGIGACSLGSAVYDSPVVRGVVVVCSVCRSEPILHDGISCYRGAHIAGVEQVA